jgi:hypothetical protein
MSKPYFISDVPLPKSQDFNALRQDGLDYIHATTSTVWTNLNPGDPGVTILDQVCYALTELGYCNDFPVKDILTKPSGELQTKDQFYLPDEILTTSPVTIADYRKYIIDGVDGVNNAVISVENGSYKTYLLIDPAVTDATVINIICNAAFFYLNKRRNLGELFQLPQALNPVSHFIYGRIEVQNRDDINEILTELETKISAYIFPKVVQTGYRQLMTNGDDVNTIFDGPLLQKGYIDTALLGDKRDILRLTELVQLISSTAGVTAVTALTFNSPAPGIKEIRSVANEVLFVNVAASVANGYLEIYSKGARMQVGSTPIVPALSNTVDEPELNTVFASQPNLHANLPQGKFRDINTYYSIQNTFPEIYGIGPDSLNENASAFKLAQSRQLKGYLLLFDQLIANQFSQLANTANLFSFKNSNTGTPTDKHEYYAVQNKLQRKRRQYPAPYRVFSPTYFYQSLYDIPHIRPLLKGHENFNFSFGLLSPKELEHKSWKAYKEDPYNPYMHGMMQFMEDDETAMSRRNDILDHLLARHGESPLLIDAIIEGSKYSGDPLKDRVIFKSLYLQNLALLSYFRYKAYNFLAATKLSQDITEVPADFEAHILCGNSSDFIFSSHKVNEAEKLQEHSFNNHSAIELKIGLLFGLRVLYYDFIVDQYNNDASAADLAYWLITQRRGLIMIETVLLNDPVFDGSVYFLLPAFIPAINNPEFMSRLRLFLDNTMPVHIPYACFLCGADQLRELIPAYVSWHNGFIYKSPDETQQQPVTSVGSLTNMLIALKNSSNA